MHPPQDHLLTLTSSNTQTRLTTTSIHGGAAGGQDGFGSSSSGNAAAANKGRLMPQPFSSSRYHRPQSSLFQ